MTEVTFNGFEEGVNALALCGGWAGPADCSSQSQHRLHRHINRRAEAARAPPPLMDLEIMLLKFGMSPGQSAIFRPARLPAWLDPDRPENELSRVAQ